MDKPLTTRPEWAPWPYYAPDEIEAATRVLASGAVNYWTGEEGRHFEHEYARHLSRRHAIVLANGTVALELALVVLGIGPGDEVITSPRTFIASASAVVMRGARPVLADIDPDSGNITAETVAGLVTPRTRAIIAVHIGGWPCDMDPLMELAREHRIVVIEDCAQAHGATYKGRAAGALGDMAAFSFCQDKIMSTAGEGGMLVMDREDWWKQAWSFKDHGKDHEAVFTREHPPGYRWVHESFGTNWRMTEAQAAIGRLQLRKVGEWVDTRNRNADILRSYMEPLDAIRVPAPPPEVRHAYYKLYAYVRPEALKSGWSRDRLLAAFGDVGIRCKVGSCSEIYREQAFVRSGFGLDSVLPVAAEMTSTAMMFEVYPTLGPDLLNEVGDLIASISKRATR